MELNQSTLDWLELLFNICLLIIPALLAVGAGAASLASIVKTARWLWSVIRPTVDEVTDPAIIYLASKTGMSPAWISEYILKHGDALIGVLPLPDKKAEAIR